MRALIYIITCGLLLFGCSSTKTAVSTFNVMDLKNVIVYKCKKDYSNNVPIMYSEKIGSITSYPAPSDVQRFLDLKPFELSNGYFLDQIGVNPSTVYLEYTLKEYSELDEAPTLETMKSKIIDFSPFDELYNLGQPNEQNNTIEKINELIKSGEIKTYRKI
ncbi:hypothetical protein N7E81_16715 [Reichenbachiella carrageenanivorans]|uniref:Uncharacterized protein n=1 Tax=Reichenbachiella carrageenanivorans TaxID=2979869 RepID=A0ABY6CYQ4_9BACT|nr:hypothetical protein [Reichenbachiella carrageenanivorans]UXX78998.1 hypothetical protein N7E81_16715 [Reichenbachiella carrageenanivorans]